MKNAWQEESLMKNVLLFFAMTMMTIAASVVAQAQTATAGAQTPFRLELAQADGLEGWELRRYVHNGLPWRITNVRLRVDTVDASRTVTASAVGCVLADVKAGGRGYFYVPVSSAASAYRDRCVVRQGRRRGALDRGTRILGEGGSQ